MGLFDFNDNSALHDQLASQGRSENATVATRLAIDRELDSRFGPEYFDRVARAYYRSGITQLARDEQRAREQALKKLASRGLLNSSIAARTLGDIQYRQSLLQQQLRQQAAQQADAAMQRVEQTRSHLYGLAQSGMPAADAAARAAALGGSLRTGSAPLITGMFADLINFGASGMQAQSMGLPGFDVFRSGGRGVQRS